MFWVKCFDFCIHPIHPNMKSRPIYRIEEKAEEERKKSIQYSTKGETNHLKSPVLNI